MRVIIVFLLLGNECSSIPYEGYEASLLVVGIVFFFVIVIVFTLPHDALESPLLVVGVVVRDIQLHLIVFVRIWALIVALGDESPLLVVGVVVRDIQLHLIVFVRIWALIVALGDEPPLLVIFLFRLPNHSELAIQEGGANPIRVADLVPLSIVLIFPFAAMHGCVPFTPFLVKYLIHPQGDTSLVIVFNPFTGRCHIFLIQ